MTRRSSRGHPSALPRLAGALVLLALACTDAPTAIDDAPAPAASVASSFEVRAALVGERIFNDRDLSINRNQSCASCHDPAWGFALADPVANAGRATAEGSIAGRFGDRRPPSAAYATQSPTLAWVAALRGWAGGNFWDGRATGAVLGTPAADQALGPFVNPLEQALPDAACVVYRVSRATYAGLYASVWGRDIFGIDWPDDTDALCAVEGAAVPLDPEDRATMDVEYGRIARSIAAFESSDRVNAFSAKFDAWTEGKAELTVDETLGRDLFNGRARCSLCHGSAARGAVLTTYIYANIGTPPNPALSNPAFIDKGLGESMRIRGYPPYQYSTEIGKMKVPTVRNVDARGAPDGPKLFMHNGALRSLEEVVHFYNTRDVLPRCASPADPQRGLTCWPAPEVGQNLQRGIMGNLGLSVAEEHAIVAFLRTLTDGFRPGRRD